MHTHVPSRANGDGTENAAGTASAPDCSQSCRCRTARAYSFPNKRSTSGVHGAGERPPCAHRLGVGHTRHVRRPRTPIVSPRPSCPDAFRPSTSPGRRSHRADDWRRRSPRVRRGGVGVDRCRAMSARAVAELTLVVKSPTAHAARGGAPARVSRAGTQRHGVDEIADLDWNGAPRDRAVAKLPDTVGAPADHAARDQQRAGMIATRRDGNRRGDAGHGDGQRRRAGGDHPITELAGVVAAPALDRAIPEDDAGMISLERYRNRSAAISCPLTQRAPVASQGGRTEDDNKSDRDRTVTGRGDSRITLSGG